MVLVLVAGPARAASSTVTFTEAPGSPIPVGSDPLGIISANFDKDCNPDLAVANFNDDNVTVLLGDGKGGFTQAVGSPFDTGTGSGPYNLASADFNGDNNPDLVVADNGSTTGTISVLLGNGTGSFGARQDFTVGSEPAVTSADFNKDGKPDLATANFSDNTVSVLLNTTPFPPPPGGGSSGGGGHHGHHHKHHGKGHHHYHHHGGNSGGGRGGGGISQ